MTSTALQLTANDHVFLESLLHTGQHDDVYLQLLRRKLETADVVLPQMISPHTATIGSRIAFSVGGGSIEQRMLTRDQKTGLDAALPVTTLRGLALLGLREGDIFALRQPSGIVEPLRLEKVSYQPQRAQRVEAAGRTVVSFPGPSASARTAPRSGSDDDDPGPRAA